VQLQLTEIARALNRAKVSAAPCAWLPALSIFDDEHYENYDYDMVGPGERRRLVRALESAGFRQKSGRILVKVGAPRRAESPGEPTALEFPRPTRLLAGDPALEFEKVVDRGKTIALATPTQILLTTLRRGLLGEGAEAELVALVREQPANLDKVEEWLRRGPSESEGLKRFLRWRAGMDEAQEEGFELRRRGRFRSELPR